jgi:hypothetical protein
VDGQSSQRPSFNNFIVRIRSAVPLQVDMANNSTNCPAQWIERGQEWYWMAPGYAVYGIVGYRQVPDIARRSSPFPTQEDLEATIPKIYWEARTMLNCRVKAGERVHGYAPTIRAAKQIVEQLCFWTDTVPNVSDTVLENDEKR